MLPLDVMHKLAPPLDMAHFMQMPRLLRLRPGRGRSPRESHMLVASCCGPRYVQSHDAPSRHAGARHGACPTAPAMRSASWNPPPEGAERGLDERVGGKGAHSLREGPHQQEGSRLLGRVGHRGAETHSQTEPVRLTVILLSQISLVHASPARCKSQGPTTHLASPAPGPDTCTRSQSPRLPSPPQPQDP